jgi:hypothetical protein
MVLWKRSQMPLSAGDFGLGPGVLNVMDRQVELVTMGLGFAAVFSPAISQDSDQAHALFSKER